MQASLDFSPRAVAARPWAIAVEADSIVRRSEWVVLAFLIYAAILGAVLPAAREVGLRVVFLNLAILSGYVALIGLDGNKRSLALSVTRDWAPLAVVILAYREMGWFAQPHRDRALETHWVVWDHVVLRGGGKALVEALGPVLPSILEIAYSLVYVLAPFAVAVLYVYGRREKVDRFLLVFVTGVLLCYAQFPFWPSEPPRVVFYGQDFPAYDTVFRRFNWWMLGNYGIRTSVFPSAHVAGAFAAAFGIWRAIPERRWLRWFLLTMAVLIAAATVYGRYHYLADAAAGLAMALLAAGIVWGVERRGKLHTGAKLMWRAQSCVPRRG
ncbi:MAG: phosphatase PAP2 family protein [Bryobacteraceae bacterium]|jgi:membrane-associated phospholipid phosphatase